MKKGLLVLLYAILLTGCNHKSSLEPVDVEQFKCQDSIETVFDVLGKTELETSGLEGERYEFKELNLYGYDGTVVFKVRDDGDTISSFYCSFTLNESEFEDVLSQLSEKYGEYERSEYSNQIAYVWEIPDLKTEELGYNRISLSDYGDKNVIINFSDEWSGYSDEVYYENLEDDDISTTFNFGNNGEIAIVIGDNSNINVWIHSESSDECSLAFAYYYSYLSAKEMEGQNTSILLNYTDDMSVMWNKTENDESIVGVNSDGSSTSELPDWVITDMSKFNISEEEQNAIAKELQENTLNFLNSSEKSGD